MFQYYVVTLFKYIGEARKSPNISSYQKIKFQSFFFKYFFNFYEGSTDSYELIDNILKLFLHRTKQYLVVPLCKATNK